MEGGLFERLLLSTVLGPHDDALTGMMAIFSPGATPAPVHTFITQLPNADMGGAWDTFSPSNKGEFMGGLNPWSYPRWCHVGISLDMVT